MINIDLLDVKDRMFVDYVLLNNMSWAEAVCKAYGRPVPKSDIMVAKQTKFAQSRLDIPVVYEYYKEMRDKMAEYEAEQATWSREMATKKLTKLIGKAEDELYEQEQKITMSRMNAVVLPVKELNELWGLKEQNININGEQTVVFKDSGEDLLD